MLFCRVADPVRADPDPVRVDPDPVRADSDPGRNPTIEKRLDPDPNPSRTLERNWFLIFTQVENTPDPDQIRKSIFPSFNYLRIILSISIKKKVFRGILNLSVRIYFE